MRKLVWIVPMIVVFVFACTERDTYVADPGTGDTPDIVTNDAGITAEFFNAENPVTEDMLSDITNYGDVRDAITTFETSGYSIDEGNSFFVRGRGPDGSPVEISVFAMGHAARPHRDAVYLFHIDCAEGRVLVPLRVSFEKTTTDAYQIGESVWFSWAGPPSAVGAPPSTAAGASPIMAGLAAKMSITEWLKCVGDRLAAGAVACGLVCRFAPVAFLQCLASCTTGHVAYALIFCSIQAL